MKLGMGTLSVLRRYPVGILIGAAIILAGCATTPPRPASGYRDTSALIGATSRFDLNRFAGAWTVREYFPTDRPLRGFEVTPGENQTFTWIENAGQGGGTRGAEQAATLGTITGQGRFKLDWYAREFWVLWVDEGFRTAVIGTPDGKFGYIVNRNNKGGADRIKAAREILDFNGYDVSQLQVIK